MAKTRVIELDVLRTVAIALMILYHLAYDLWAFYGWNIELGAWPWELLRVTTVSLFLLVAGATSHFSARPIKRATLVLLAAVGITVATYLFDKETFIYFGILHCIGLGLLATHLLKPLKELNVLIGLCLLLLPVQEPPLPTLDYYPLLPWAGLMLIGSGVGHYLYVRHSCRALKQAPRILTWPGRHALLLYLVHQPVLLLILWLML